MYQCDNCRSHNHELVTDKKMPSINDKNYFKKQVGPGKYNLPDLTGNKSAIVSSQNSPQAVILKSDMSRVNKFKEPPKLFQKGSDSPGVGSYEVSEVNRSSKNMQKFSK